VKRNLKKRKDEKERKKEGVKENERKIK